MGVSKFMIVYTVGLGPIWLDIGIYEYLNLVLELVSGTHLLNFENSTTRIVFRTVQKQHVQKWYYFINHKTMTLITSQPFKRQNF